MSSRKKNDREKGREEGMDDRFALLEEEEERQLAMETESEEEMQDQPWKQEIASVVQADLNEILQKTTVNEQETTVNEPESLRVDVAHPKGDAPPLSKPAPSACDVISDLESIDESQSSNPAAVGDGNATVLAEKASMLRGKQLRNSRSNEDTVVRRTSPRGQDSATPVLNEKAVLRGRSVRLRRSRLGKEATEVHHSLVQSQENMSILSEKANLFHGRLQSSRSDPEIDVRQSVESQANSTVMSAKADMMRGASRRLQSCRSVKEPQRVRVQTQANSTFLAGKADMFQRKLESSRVAILREKPDLIRRVHSDSNLQAAPRDPNLGLFMVEHDGRVVMNPTTNAVATSSSGVSPPGAYASFPSGASPNDADESLTQAAYTEHTEAIGGSSRTRRSHSLVPIEAQMVSDESKELVMATPDSWWRQNQWWLLALLLLVILGVVLAVVFTTINNGSDAPATPAPTTFEEGVQSRAEALIEANGVDVALWSGDSLSPQARALDFVVSRKIDEGDGLADTQLLQQFALAALYYATGGGNETWVDYGGWLQDSDECNWFGVSCDDETPNDAAITSLDLSMNDLRGTIPPELALLSNSLSALVLSESHLGGSLPSELGSLSKLTTLDVSDNDLSGSLPASLGGLSLLVNLNLSMNEFDGRLPETIGSLSLLHHVSLANNLLTGEVPSEIGLMTSLEYMDFSHNRLSYALPVEIGQLSLLTELHVQHNNLLGPLPTDLSFMTNLRHFDMSNNFVFGVIPDELALLQELQSLGLDNNLLSGTIPEDILRLTKLVSLHLGGNFLRGTMPTNCCSRLTNRRNRFRLRDLGATLEELDLSGNFLEYSSDDGTGELLFPVDFFELSNLVLFNMSNADLSGAIPAGFGRLTSLKKLELDRNKLVGSIPSTLGSLSKLEELSLGEGYYVVGADTDKSFPNHNPVARTVGNRLVGSIPSELYQISSMKSLQLSLNQLTGTLSSEIGLWTQLESIDLSLNNLSGELPVELFRLRSLRDVRCALNKFDPGPIPSDIGRWSSMTTLHLYRSNRVGSIPSQLSRLTLLEDLRLGNNALNSTFPTAVMNITSLRILELGANKIHGTIPAVGWSSLSELTTINLNANKLTGTIPTDFYGMENVERIHINQNPFTGTISSLIFQMPRLTLWSAAQTQLSGTIPTEIGLSRTLSEFVFHRNELTGTIPTETGLLRTLANLRLDRNNLNGTLPIELWSLPRLGNLQAFENNLVGSIPSEIGQLLNLGSLFLWKNQLTGSLPSEIGLLPLQGLRLEENNFSGALPQQLSNLLYLHTVHLNNNFLTGSFPYELCDAPYIFIDCESVICACCGCSSRPPSNSPSITGTPTYSPTVTASPTLSLTPTTTPSSSMMPSSSMVPTVQDACGRFSSLANVNGSRAVNLTKSFNDDKVITSDEGYAIISLPFVFRWRGMDPYSEILINTNGAVYPGSDRAKILICKRARLCWTASKVVLEGNFDVPRIAAAQEDLDLTNTNGTIYTYSTVDTMIISFESIGVFGDDAGTPLNFQVVLEEGGRIELRWGDGSLPEGRQVAAGVEDDINNVAAPATGGPFNLQGVTAGGRWPGFSCRAFVPINGTYVEWSPLAE